MKPPRPHATASPRSDSRRCCCSPYRRRADSGIDGRAARTAGDPLWPRRAAEARKWCFWCCSVLVRRGQSPLSLTGRLAATTGGAAVHRRPPSRPRICSPLSRRHRRPPRLVSRPERTSSRLAIRGGRALRRSMTPSSGLNLSPQMCAAAIGVAMAVIGVIWRRIRWLALCIAVIIEATGDAAFRSAVRHCLSDQLLHLAHRVRRHRDRAWRAPVRRQLRHLPRRRGARRWSAARSLPLARRSRREAFSAHSDVLPGSSRTGSRHRRDGTMPGFAGVLSSEAIWHLIDTCARRRWRRLASNRKLAAAAGDAAVRCDVPTGDSSISTNCEVERSASSRCPTTKGRNPHYPTMSPR